MGENGKTNSRRNHRVEVNFVQNKVLPRKIFFNHIGQVTIGVNRRASIHLIHRADVNIDQGSLFYRIRPYEG